MLTLPYLFKSWDFVHQHYMLQMPHLVFEILCFILRLAVREQGLEVMALIPRVTPVSKRNIGIELNFKSQCRPFPSQGGLLASIYCLHETMHWPF